MKSLISLFLLLSLFIFSTFTAIAAISEVEYQLPYPGILPGNTLYSLKEIRDKISGFLIKNPLKKAEFNLLKSDVRISAAISLSEQKKDISIIETTLARAVDYYNEALTKTREAKEQGMDIRDFVKKLSLANQKHVEILENIEKKVEKKDINKIELLKKRIKTLDQELRKIR